MSVSTKNSQRARKAHTTFPARLQSSDANETGKEEEVRNSGLKSLEPSKHLLRLQQEKKVGKTRPQEQVEGKAGERAEIGR